VEVTPLATALEAARTRAFVGPVAEREVFAAASPAVTQRLRPSRVWVEATVERVLHVLPVGRKHIRALRFREHKTSVAPHDRCKLRPLFDGHRLEEVQRLDQVDADGRQSVSVATRPRSWLTSIVWALWSMNATMAKIATTPKSTATPTDRLGATG
jgi:hypothetical protein